MINVQCESCQAPYQVDEKRVPPHGLKMRCPKCGFSFLVLKPDSPAVAHFDGDSALPALRAAAGTPKPPNAGASAPRAPTLVSAVAPPPAADLPIAKAAPPRIAPMLRKPAPPIASIDPLELDLPARVANADLPATRAGRPVANGVASAAGGAFGALDLPGDLGGGFGDLDLVGLPAKVGSSAADSAAAVGSTDLPALRPRGAADLPALHAKGARPPAVGAPAKSPVPLTSDTAPRTAPKVQAKSGLADFGELDLPALASGVDLPSVQSADLPSVPGAGLPALQTAGLPVVQRAGLPALQRADLPALQGAGLPALQSAALPAVQGVGLPALQTAGLPVVQRAGLPALQSAGLPVVQGAPLPSLQSAGLPVVQSADLPLVGGNLPQLGGQLPTLAEQLPSILNSYPGRRLMSEAPAAQPRMTSGFDFGAFDLASPSAADDPFAARDLSAGPSNPPAAAFDGSLFGELELPTGDSARSPAFGAPSRSSDRPAAGPSLTPPTSGGGGYGEVDLGGGADNDTSTSFDVEGIGERPGGMMPAATIAIGSGVLEVALPEKVQDAPVSVAKVSRPVSRGAKIAVAAVTVIVLAAGALEFTSLGAFGRYPISDAIHAKGWEARAAAMSAEAKASWSADTYAPLQKTVDGVAQEHEQTPRAQAIAAYAAYAEYMFQLRFGPDAGRAARATGWLKDVPKESNVPFASLAYAAKAAREGDLPGARNLARRAGNSMEAQILRGEIELRAKAYPAALSEFKSALTAGAGANANFGLARVNAALHDNTATMAALEAALKSSPNHPSAHILKATLLWARGKPEDADKDLRVVLDGPAKGVTSPKERSWALTLRGAILFEGAKPGEAKAAFDEAIKLDPQNVDALVGEGDVNFADARYTEALTRYEASLSADPRSILGIVGATKTKIQLERLQDAKTLITGARAAQPTSMQLAIWSGKVEEALGDKSGAEKDYQAALALVDKKDPNSVEAYVAMSSYLAARGKPDEASAKLREAKEQLPPNWMLDRAFGDVAVVQGQYDQAIAHYEAARTKRPGDFALRFRLGVTYRRMNKLDLARKELDGIAAQDKNFPGLAFERGLLFEQAGEVDKALAEFKGALEKAPNDLDLKLRVGAAYVSIRKPDDALPMLEDVLKQRGTSAEANHYMGRARLLQGPAQNITAMRFLKRAVELDPNRAEYHLYVAWAANDANPTQLSVAKDAVDKALAIDKLLADAYWQRGIVLRREKAVTDALADLEHALVLKPTRFEAYATIAECYQDLNQEDKALGAWRRAIAGDEHQPVWRYYFGKLLLERHQSAEGLTHLTYAVNELEKETQRPGFLNRAEFELAEALRKNGHAKESVAHYRAFLQFAPTSDPDRLDAKNALAAMHASETDN